MYQRECSASSECGGSILRWTPSCVWMVYRLLTVRCTWHGRVRHCVEVLVMAMQPWRVKRPDEVVHMSFPASQQQRVPFCIGMHEIRHQTAVHRITRPEECATIGKSYPAAILRRPNGRLRQCVERKSLSVARVNLFAYCCLRILLLALT